MTFPESYLICLHARDKHGPTQPHIENLSFDNSSIRPQQRESTEIEGTFLSKREVPSVFVAGESP